MSGRDNDLDLTSQSVLGIWVGDLFDHIQKVGNDWHLIQRWCSLHWKTG